MPAAARGWGRARFVAAAVHDLLQPLNAARMFIGALADGALAPAERQLVEQIRSALDTQDDMLASLLDVSRLEGGAVEARFSAVLLGPMLAELGRQFAVLGEARGLDVRQVETTVVVRSDPLLLRRVLQNFLSNAVHYTPRGRVLLGVRRLQGYARVEVWDTGIGIPETKTRAIFDEFLRLDNGVDRDRRGAGLGLSIVDRIARLLGAPVSVRSWPGRGSVFSITVPLALEGTGYSGSTEHGVDDSPFRGTRVLLIDGDAAARRVTSALLSSWGCDVVTVGSAEAALRHAETDEAPAILLQEDPLDGASGDELREALIARWGRSPPTVLLSVAPSAAAIEHARALGLRYLVKPLAPARLRAVMSRLLMTSD